MDRSKMGIGEDILLAVFVDQVDRRQSGYSGSLNEELSVTSGRFKARMLMSSGEDIKTVRDASETHLTESGQSKSIVLVSSGISIGISLHTSERGEERSEYAGRA
jgi:hypothetical protein